jgi:predicted anti-sigma-YlaC factor YlaD
MSIPVSNSDCTRAREAVSARLDGELSELEGARLDLHLRRCAACRAYADQATQIVAELRRAPLHPVETPVFEARRRRSVSALRIPAAAAAVFAAAVVGGSFLLGQVIGGSGGAPTATGTRSSARAAAELASVRADTREQRLLAMLPPASNRRGPGVRLGPNLLAL